MNRHRPEFQAIDVNAWPTVAHTELGEAARRTFETRRQAVGNRRVVRWCTVANVDSISSS